MIDIRGVGLYVSNLDVRLKKCAKTAPRATGCYELEIPVAEGGTIYVDGEPIRIKPGIAVLIPPGVMRHTVLHLKCYYVHFSVCAEDRATLDALPRVIPLHDSEVFVDLIMRMRKYKSAKSDLGRLMLQSLAYELLWRLLGTSRESEASGVSRSAAAAVKNAKKYISDNISSELSLSKVASSVGYSAIRFHEIFKAVEGQTLRDYVEREKIARATELILSTDYTLARIAYECGFSSQSYFSYAFKRRMGMTPREYARHSFIGYGGD